MKVFKIEPSILLKAKQTAEKLVDLTDDFKQRGVSEKSYASSNLHLICQNRLQDWGL